MYTLGIDFGTTNSCISYINDTQSPVIILNTEGQYTTPSCIYFDKSGDLIGSAAYSILVQNNKNTISQNLIYNFKRLFGIKYDDYIKNDKLVEFFNKRENVIVEDTSSGLCAFNIIEDGEIKQKRVTEIVKIYLEYLINVSRTKIDFDINDIIITVPTYFNDFQRSLLKSIYTSLNLNVIRIVNEPTAAALAYNKIRECNVDGVTNNILVVDCGGGTTDTSIVSIENDQSESFFEVVSVSGDNYLGGEDITDMLFQYAKTHWVNNGDNLTQNQKKQLMIECEMTKRILSYKIANTLIFNDNIIKRLTRNELNEIVTPFFKKIKDLIKETVQFKKVDKVVFVGGTTRMSYFVDIIHSIFGNDISIYNTLDPDHTVSIGAAYYGYTLNSHTKDDVTVIDVLSMSIGVETLGGFMTSIVSKNSQLPITKSKIFTNSEDNINEMKIEIFQGERRFVRDNYKIGELILKGLDNSLKKGEMNIKVTIDIDTNSIISVTANDLKTGNEINCVLQYNCNTGETIEEIQNAPSEDNDSEDELLYDSIRSNMMVEILEFGNTLQFAKKSVKYIEENYDIDDNTIYLDILELLKKTELYINESKEIIFEKECNITLNDIKEKHTWFKNTWHKLMISLFN